MRRSRAALCPIFDGGLGTPPLPPKLRCSPRRQLLECSRDQNRSHDLHDGLSRLLRVGSHCHRRKDRTDPGRPRRRAHIPIPKGSSATRSAEFDQRVYHDSRILYPQRRVGPKGEARFERISWDEAISTIVEKFRAIIARWGAEAILPYHYDGSNGLLSHDFLDAYFFAKLGASRLARTLCAAPATAVAMGMYGKMPGVAFQDYPKARAILVWGANPKYSNIHLVPYLREARKNGAFVAVIDPIRNFSSSEIDLHLPVYPGADLPVALAMIRQWQEEGRLDRAFLAQHADGLSRCWPPRANGPSARAAEEARVPAGDIARIGACLRGRVTGSHSSSVGAWNEIEMAARRSPRSWPCPLCSANLASAAAATPSPTAARLNWTWRSSSAPIRHRPAGRRAN